LTRSLKILYILRAEWGLIGANAAYYLPVNASKAGACVETCSAPSLNPASKIIVFPPPDFPNNMAVSHDPEIRGKSIAKTLTRFKPDIIHAFYFRNIWKTLEYIPKALLNRSKLIIDIRTPLLSQSRREKLGFYMRNTPWNRRISHYFGLNKAVFKSTFPAAPMSKFTAVPTSLNASMFSGSSLRDVTRPPRNFVYLGSLARIRRLNGLVEGFAQAVTRGANIHLHMIGGGNDEAALQALVEDMGMAKHIHFTGQVGQLDIPVHLVKMDAAITYIPDDIFNHAISLKSFEYGAAGLPVIASNQANLGELESSGLPVLRFNNQAGDIADIFVNLSSGALVFPQPENWNRLRDYIAKNDWSFIYRTIVAPSYLSMAEPKGNMLK